MGVGEMRGYSASNSDFGVRGMPQLTQVSHTLFFGQFEKEIHWVTAAGVGTALSVPESRKGVYRPRVVIQIEVT